MRNADRRGPARSWRWGLALALAAVVSLGAMPARAIELEGTYHVLVHYRDDTTHDPKQLRWDDRIWIFERKGKDLVWTEYPIVVFDDETGRFESLGGSGARRVVGAWEPTPIQLEQIRNGLEYNTRGMKKKTLRGSDGSGWTSGSRGATPQAANVITYSETWSITGPPDAPVFTRDDILGSASAEAVEGRTQYTTEKVEQDGAILHGGFERDGTRHGTFTIRRAGEAKITDGSGKSQSARMMDMFLSRYGADLFSPAELEGIHALSAEGKSGPQGAKELRAKIRAEVERKTRESGVEPSAVEPEIDRLTDRIEQMVLDGKSAEQIQRELAQPGGAR